MVSLIIMTVMAISLVAAMGYSAFTMVDSTERIAQAQRNAAQMHKLAALVEANLRTLGDDGVLNVPAPSGQPDGGQPDGGSGLPEWLAPGVRTPWGVAYGYCVYAPAADRTAAAPVVRSWPFEGAPGARAYVTAAPPAPAAVTGTGVIAAIVAPAIGADRIPDCDKLTLREGQFVIPEGTAVAVTRGMAADLTALSATATMRRHVAPQTRGSGTGTSAADAMSLTAALGLWQAVRPATTILLLESGRHEVPFALLEGLAASSAAGGRAMRLVLQSSVPGAVVASVPSGGIFRVPTDVVVENVTFETGFEIMPGTQATFAGANAIATSNGPALRVVHARLDVTGGLELSSGNADGLVVQGGQALVRDADLAVTVGTGRTAVVSGVGGAITLTGERRRPRLVVQGRGLPMAAIRSGGSATILDHADLVVDNGTQFGVVLENGSLELRSTSVGSSLARPAAAGVLDLGGARIVADKASQVWVAPGGACAKGGFFQGDEGTEARNRMAWACRN